MRDKWRGKGRNQGDERWREWKVVELERNEGYIRTEIKGRKKKAEF